jgi:LysR family cys regulon transcriptional activator
LFGTNITRMAFKRGSYLRNFVYEFAQLVSPHLTPSAIEQAMNR